MSEMKKIGRPEILEAASAFTLYGELKSFAPYGSGHINDTISAVFDQAGKDVRYILQRINEQVFRNVPALMENIARVSDHVASKVEPGDNRRALQLIPADSGAPFHRTSSGNCWRLYLFIEGSRTYDELTSSRQAFEAARAFGQFQRLLTDLPAPRLNETIPDFHKTRKRFENLRNAIQADSAGRCREAEREIEFAMNHEDIVDRLLDLAAQGAIPERVTHNDTKINNVMLDDKTGEGICVIDLDTVMPGLSLYDFGDLVRTAVSPAPEDEKDLSRIGVRAEFFEALVRGFADSMGTSLTDAEWENLAFSGRLITLEIGLRFLTDFLQGDVYFKTRDGKHNLQRAQSQFRLVECLKSESNTLDSIVHIVRREIRQ